MPDRREQLAAAQRKRRERLALEGKCLQCGEPAEKNRTHCREHLDGINLMMNRLHQQRRDAGLCTICGKNPPDGELLNCRVCLDAISARSKRKRDMEREMILQEREEALREAA